MATTIKQKEIDQFQKDSSHWWDERGPFAPLHQLNPIRMRFMRDALDQIKCRPGAGRDLKTSRDPGLRRGDTVPLNPLTHLDIGCGGGLVCEPFARLGAHVTGLDADQNAIKVAQDHARKTKLNITYHANSIEQFRKQNKNLSFDVITALEIIEHVAAPELFLAEATAMLKPGGVLFVSTLNRTIKSFALGVVAAEYILGWVPKGTHDWRQFIAPSTLTRCVRSLGLTPVAASGLCYAPLNRKFYLDPHDLSVNYIMAFVKK